MDAKIINDIEQQNKEASTSSLPDECACCDAPISDYAAEAFDGLCAECL